MEKKQSSLHTKKSKVMQEQDLCPVCDFNLYFNSKYTQRIGVLNGTKDVIGWICPECASEFDKNNNICLLYTSPSPRDED